MSSRVVLNNLLEEINDLQGEFSEAVFTDKIETADLNNDVNNIDDGFESLRCAILVAINNCVD